MKCEINNASTLIKQVATLYGRLGILASPPSTGPDNHGGNDGHRAYDLLLPSPSEMAPANYHLN
jgi:hypothetical protein